MDKWIKASESMPDAETAVLCYQKLGHDFYLTFVGYILDGEWREFRCSDDEVEPVRAPTHWQPLPEPPHD